MKILHILDHSIPLHSGYTFRTRAILEQQRSLGWETTHITSSKHIASCPDEESVDGFHFYRTKQSNSFISKLPIVDQLDVVSGLSTRLDYVIQKESPDILHAHSPSLNGLAALRAGKRHNLPVVYECRAFWEDAAVDHGTCREGDVKYNLTRAIETYVFKRADLVTTICEGLKKDIVSRGVPSESVVVIPNAVDIERFVLDNSDDQELSDKLGISNKTVLGFIGSFYAYEGLSLLVKSLPQVLKRQPDVCLLLVGGGPQEKELQDLVIKMGLEEHVVFTGRVPHQDVDKYYNLVDILVYPRLSMRLTDIVTPLKPLEAMALGKLVLASDVGGHKELIHNGQNGRMFRAGDLDSLAQEIVDLIKHRGEWQDIRIKCRDYVERERNWYASVIRYNEPYNKLLERSKASF